MRTYRAVCLIACLAQYELQLVRDYFKFITKLDFINLRGTKTHKNVKENREIPFNLAPSECASKNFSLP